VAGHSQSAQASDQRPRDIVAANAATLVRRSMMTLVSLIERIRFQTLWCRYSGHM
jgi:hypothetical protein